MPPTSFCNGAFELMASAGSTFRLPGPDSGIRPICTYFERALNAPKSAPGSRCGHVRERVGRRVPGNGASDDSCRCGREEFPSIPADFASASFRHTVILFHSGRPGRGRVHHARPRSALDLDGNRRQGRIPIRRPRAPPGHQTWATPPSTNSSIPLMKELLSEARNRTASATSIGRPTRPTGATSLCPFRKPAICSSVMPKLS